MAWRRHGFERQAGSSTRGLQRVPRRSFMSFTIWTAQTASIHRQWIQDERETALLLLTPSFGVPSPAGQFPRVPWAKPSNNMLTSYVFLRMDSAGVHFIRARNHFCLNGKVISVVKFLKVPNRRWHCVMVLQTDRQTGRQKDLRCRLIPLLTVLVRQILCECYNSHAKVP